MESIVQMIQRALGYLMHNLTNAIPDVILGVLLTKANVQWSLLELESRQSTDALLLTRLKHLLVMCDDVITSFWAGHQHYDECELMNCQNQAQCDINGSFSSIPYTLSKESIGTRVQPLVSR